MSVTVKSAWITGSSVVFAALISGIFLSISKPNPVSKPEMLEKLLIDIPAGSRVTIIVKSDSDDDKEKTESKFEQFIKKNTKLSLIETESILSEISFNESSANEIKISKDIVDYIVVYDSDIGSAQLFDTASGHILRALNDNSSGKHLP